MKDRECGATRVRKRAGWDVKYALSFGPTGFISWPPRVMLSGVCQRQGAARDRNERLTTDIKINAAVLGAGGARFGGAPVARSPPPLPPRRKKVNLAADGGNRKPAGLNYF